MTPEGGKLLGTRSIGDKVLVQSADGVQRYEKVMDFLHKTGTFAQFFVTIEHTFGVMRASANHLILKADGGEFVADDARVGDALHTSQGIATVLAVYKSYEKMGMFAPLTSSGTVVVDGVVASNYASVLNLDISHSAMHACFFMTRILNEHVLSIFKGRYSDVLPLDVVLRVVS
eukprot:TRINITY_DN15561_c0_g2_i1.p2 TRINITY_DN15561_c0_g2~~TRINITY_DN15561_c0_g2_i1.p2  ORF type:complete len:174 (+),score=34.82 TRINITY_DN15561_c0_g2_i1:828-1349(+)